MPLPPHTQIVLFLYTHAAVVTILRRDFASSTLFLHPFATAFIFFHPRATGLVPVAHGLWLAWIASVTGVQGSAVLALLIVGAALALVLLTAQFVRRSQRHGKAVAEAELMVGVGIVAVIMMAVVARNSNLSFVGLHSRTAAFYTIVWLLEIAVHQSGLLAHASLEIISLTLAFAVLAVPLWLAVAAWIATAAAVILNFGTLVSGGRAHTPGQ